MRGTPIEAVKVGLSSLISTLRRDPYALESAYVSVITYDLTAKLCVPLTEIGSVAIPDIPVPRTSPTNLGEALKLVLDRYDQEVVLSTPEAKGDWKPILVVMTDGAPSDTFLFNQMVERIKSYEFAKIICCAAGPKAKVEPLKALTDDVKSLETLDAATFTQFVTWVSTAIVPAAQESDAATDDDELPPPPDSISI